MEKLTHIISIVITDRDNAIAQVNDLLHKYADNISLRVGYPVPQKAASIIFLILELTLDELGSFSGKLGQIPSVKVKVTTLKI
jgi:putative iron-only hydrogenase system regulator